MTWSERQQELLTPNNADFARSMAMTAGLAEGNTDAVDLATFEAAQAGRLPQMQIASSELLIRGHDLRDNPEALAQWRIALADHRARAEREEQE